MVYNSLNIHSKFPTLEKLQKVSIRLHHLAYTLLLLVSFLAKAQDNQLSNQEIKDGWQLLFDGKTSNGWKGAFLQTFPNKGWRIENNMLIVDTSNGGESTNGGDIVTTKLYSNFILKVEFMITEGANSGIKYFVNPTDTAASSPRSAFGLEFQILDDAKHPDAKMGREGNRTIGSLYDLIPAPTTKHVNPVGTWNEAMIISKGMHVEHWLNGVKLLEYERGSNAFNSNIAMSKYKSIPGFGLYNEVRILLQDHGNKVYFKNIKINTKQ